MSIPRVLTIAGTDPTGGAGAAADIKSISAAGGYALSVITALVSQNTQGVTALYCPPASVIADQLAAVSADVELDSVKIGMLGNVEYIQVVGAWLREYAPNTVVIDPVMVATSGDRLLEPDAEEELRKLLSLATIVTPNIPELEILTGRELGSLETHEAALAAAQELARDIDALVVVKGGHLHDATVINAVVGADGVIAQAHSPRIDTTSTHGTGCSMSSALATKLAEPGRSIASALDWVTTWLTEAIRHGSELQVGHGHGPIDHTHHYRRLTASLPGKPWSVAVAPLAQPADVDVADLAQLPGIASAEGTADNQESVRDAIIQSAGPWTALLWESSKEILQATWELPFIQGLADGTLPAWEFTAYQRQDALYLNAYSRALANLAAKAPSPAEIVAWASSSAECITVEQELHRNWLAGHGDDFPEASWEMTPTTAGYTDHLLARSGVDPYVVGVAAVLPCFWLYAHIGELLTQKNSANHPYHEWLTLYADEDFIQVTAERIAMLEQAMAVASPDERARAMAAYILAARWEYEFFDQSRLMR